MNEFLLSGVAGAGAGGIVLFLSHIAPRFGAGNFLRDLDELFVFGREYTRRESHVLGVLIHLLLCLVFGVVYKVGVDQGIAPGYGFWPLIAYAVLLTVFLGGVVMPLEGHGLFGVRDDAWFPVDLFLTNLGWVFFFSFLMSLWLPVV
jgi:hypothetical protein